MSPVALIVIVLPMSPVALIVIVLFLVAMGALNLVEFGRVD